MAQPKPRAAIRRFDVFAEYNRIEALKEKHLSAAKAKGYGLWVAKVVAAQKFGRLPKRDERAEKKEPKLDSRGWCKLSGVSQTDKLFDKEIVRRMGEGFYRKVFSPAIRKAHTEGRRYVEIRDRIRAKWKPEKLRQQE